MTSSHIRLEHKYEHLMNMFDQKVAVRSTIVYPTNSESGVGQAWRKNDYKAEVCSSTGRSHKSPVKTCQEDMGLPPWHVAKWELTVGSKS